MKPERPIKSTVIVTILRFSIIVVIALLPALFVSGQVKFSTWVSSQNIGQKEYLQIEFAVENAKQIDELTPPSFPGFQIVQGPVQSSGMTVVNGSMSQYKGLSFVLQPLRTGKFIIDGATATVDGHPLRSNAVRITVHAGGSPGGNNPSNPGGGNPYVQPFNVDPYGNAEREVERDYILKPGENVNEKIRKNLFVKVQVDKNSCFVGEPIVATYKLYSRLSSESRVTKRPSLNGFSVYDMVDPGSDPVSVEKLNGKAFTVHIIRKTQLIPLQAGNIDLDPVEVDNTVHFVKGGRQEIRRGGSIRDLLDQMMDDNNLGPEVDERVTLDTKPVTITVKPLPENKPANYNGAVGSFSIETSLANRSVAAQDEATLHVVVKGKGNLPVLAAPAIVWPSGFEAFEPTAKEDVNKTIAPMSGSKSFDYVFVPRTPGHYTLPAVSFSYFDPVSQTYKSAEGQPQDLQVTPAVSQHRPTVGSGAVASSFSITSRVGKFIQDHLEWIFAVLLISGVAMYFWRQNLRLRRARRDGKGSDEEHARQEKENLEKGFQNTSRTNDPFAYQPVARANAPVPSPPEPPKTPGMASNTYVPAVPVADPLLEARQFLEEGDSSRFYREVNRAIWKAIQKKLGLPASELNKQNSIRLLQIRGWDETAIISLENILNECEMNLYTPAYDRYNMQQILRQAEWMVDRLA
ncbi:MAG TPA: BatD family protein [Puia sp.]|nr:BatD family protein [Puia sp.]